MILLEAVTWLDVAQAGIIVIPATIGTLIGFLKYIEGYFKGKDQDRELQYKEQNENRSLFIKTVVNEHLDMPLKKIHEMLETQEKTRTEQFAYLGKRIDEVWKEIKK